MTLIPVKGQFWFFRDSETGTLSTITPTTIKPILPTEIDSSPKRRGLINLKMILVISNVCYVNQQMANNTITFNPDSSVEAYGVNLVISTRSDFKSTFKVLRPDKSNFDFTSYTGSSQMAKSVSIGSSLG